VLSLAEFRHYFAEFRHVGYYTTLVVFPILANPNTYQSKVTRENGYFDNGREMAVYALVE